MKMEMDRRKSKVVMVGDVAVGGDNPISVQSMTTSKTEDADATIKQIHELEEAGCQIVRVTVPNLEAAQALTKIKKSISIPLVADIHFDYKMALIAIDAGIDKIRINPGNIGKEERIAKVLAACKSASIPIRIGVNSGSLEKHILDKYKFPTADGMVESARHHLSICKKYDFDDVIVALKSSSVPMMISAYRKFATEFDKPIHLGVTEAGPRYSGTIKSSIGIGTLLAEGIGDTIRVSLTDNPVQEVKVGFEILKSLGLVSRGITLVSCPTCGRLQVDLFKIIETIEPQLEKITKPLKVAVMGCAVNGPGEASDSDIGIACGKDDALFYIKGKKAGKVPEKDIVPTLLKYIDEF